jgi:serine/threonine-protein kinase
MGTDCDFVKVLDFGLVKMIISETENRLTDTGTAGTPAYMAPEVALGRQEIDGRADLYSLGCVAYWLLTGHLVFDEKSPTATALAHVQGTPIPPSQQSGIPVPDLLERATLSCLAKSPAARPADAEMLSRMLADCTDVGPWTQEDAERWWNILPPDSPDPTPQIKRISDSTNAMSTL